MTTRSIDDDDLKVLFFEFLHTLRCNDHWIRLCVTSIEWNPCFCSVLFDLIKSTSSEGIGTNQASLPAFPLVVVGELCTCGSFTRSLQADKHDDVVSALGWLPCFSTRINQLHQLLVHG